MKNLSSLRSTICRIAVDISAYFNLLPCPLCGSGDGGGRNDFCPECLKTLPFITADRICPGCGGELDGMLARCSGCLDGAGVIWRSAAAIFEYRDAASELIRDFKFTSHPQLARPLGKYGAELVRRREFPVDVIVPVPIAFTRFLRRSYNQSELFADAVAGELGLPVVKALRCQHGAVRQSALRRSARLRNPAKRFYPAGRRSAGRISGCRVLLVDDIITTGATLHAAARILRRLGAREIYVLTAARTPRR